jgi:hypothetical protein
MRRYRGTPPAWLREARSKREQKRRAENPRCYTRADDFISPELRLCGHGLSRSESDR